jgi:transglutaminase-like putative cysteine protease
MSADCSPTEFLDHASPEVRGFLERVAPDRGRPPRELAVALYYAIRDGIEYEIYGVDFARERMRASAVVEQGRGLCVHKSTLFATCARALGIPSRLVLVDVRNHVASPRLKRYLDGDVVHYHCYAQLELGERWVSATPVFSARLCRLYRMAPLEFDGVTDAVLQPYDEDGNAHMEVVHRHGVFDDLPYELLVAGLRRAHPRIFASATRVRSGSLAAEAVGAG